MSVDKHARGRVSEGGGDEPGSAQSRCTGMAHSVKYPLCGMDVDPHTTAHRASLDGRS